MEKEIKSSAPSFAKEIQRAAQSSNNEAEFRTKITQLIEDFGRRINLSLNLREEYTLINGRADAVYNRLVVEYKEPGKLRQNNDYPVNQNAISQLEGYIDGLIRREHHKPERLAGVVLDGDYFIFIRKKEGLWHIDNPIRVNEYSTEHFLKLIFSLSTELALIPENLVRDFGENTNVSRKVVGSFLSSLISTEHPKPKALFEQWSLQFSEVCDYEEAGKIKIEQYARRFGISSQNIRAFPFFFCLHTYYAILIKLLAVQVVQYYAMPRLGTDLKQATTLGNNELLGYLKKMEGGGIFKELGISNFLEGDFFGWYLDAWNDEIYQSLKTLISNLANYSLVTLDVDPDTTRDLLKKLYQQLIPRELRHNLGEYYTPDWLAERLLYILMGKETSPDKRVLDPACGSGTFLVIAIKKMREYALEKPIPENMVLEKILSNVVGFDLNPLAVISARTNYLLALGDLLAYRKDEINIPVYLCDSIMTPQEGRDMFTEKTLRFNTAVGPFAIPKSLIKAQYIDELSNFLEEAVNLNLNRGQFIERLCQRLPLNPEQDERDIDVVCQLYEKLLNLKREDINGIWARIMKNAFAPLFVDEFDYVAGNPPWVNWESLPEGYRLETKPLWVKYGLFPHGGMDTILGKGKKDISMIMTYVAIDKYLKKGGKLGFLITQSVFKTAGAGQGFRRFQLGNIPIQVLHVDDMVELNPFEGASNRTSIVILQKGKPTKYPLPLGAYLYWRKTAKRKSISLEATLEEALGMTERKQFVAEPVNADDITSPWITGRPKALRAVKKILGQSDYTAHAGCYSGGANGVYWVEIIDKRPDGLVIVSNITEGAKREVEAVQAAIEQDLLYPLLRGRDVKRWKAEPSAYIIMAQDPVKRRGIEEDKMKTSYPKTYMYLKRFEELLRKRRARGVTDMIKGGAPFYTMFAVGDYTFAPYKVVWPNIASEIVSAVISAKDGKLILPQHIVTLVACNSLKEAHYICAIMNSEVVNFSLQAYSMKGGKSFGDPHVLQNIHIPKFDHKNTLHLSLAKLSEKAHEETAQGNPASEIEAKIDELSAEIWGLTKEELKEIEISLKELSK
ncbi:MAG: N-6 DNA methylase [bacterium]